MITLGQASNYSAKQVWGHLFAWGTKRDFIELKQNLARRYKVAPKQVLLYHTGRSALAAALKSVAPEGGWRVIIPGLTCIAVVRAVKAAGCTPVFVDIEPKNLEYNYAKLEAKLTELDSCSTNTLSLGRVPRARRYGTRALVLGRDLRRPAEKVFAEQTVAPDKPIDKNNNVCYNGSIVLIQNTLGIAWDAQKLEKITQKYGAEIVEDLAHSAGRFYADGREAGTIGAAAALSFGKGKAIDTISGGAAILRKDGAVDKMSIEEHQVSNSEQGQGKFNSKLVQPHQKPKLSDRLRDRWYPFFGILARSFGKVGQKMMGCLVKIHWVQRSADAELDLGRRLTYWQARLANRQLAYLPKAPLREFWLVERRSELLEKLQQQGYCLNEIWYDTPVSPVRYYEEAEFPERECPVTVKISRQIINFPTWYEAAKMTKAYEIARSYQIDENELNGGGWPLNDKKHQQGQKQKQEAVKNKAKLSESEAR